MTRSVAWFQDTSLPVAVFVWSVENRNDEEVEISIMFTFQNGDGRGGQSGELQSGGHYNESFKCRGVHSTVKVQDGTSDPGSAGCSQTSDVTGVLLHHQHPTQPYTLAIAAKAQSRVSCRFLRNLCCVCISKGIQLSNDQTHHARAPFQWFGMSLYSGFSLAFIESPFSRFSQLFWNCVLSFFCCPSHFR